VSERTYTPRLSWVSASENDLRLYRANLTCHLRDISIPSSAKLCKNMKCKDQLHVHELNQYFADITQACLSAGFVSIPRTRSRKETGRLPGWSEEVEPVRQKSMFWHGIWVDCGRPRTGQVADCMRRTRAAYHYAIRCIKKMKNRSYVTVLLMHFSIMVGVIFGSKLIKFGQRKHPTAKLLMTVLVRRPLLRGSL